MEAVEQGLRQAAVPGRMEHYVSADGRVSVIVDYAHNGMSLEYLSSAPPGPSIRGGAHPSSSAAPAARHRPPGGHGDGRRKPWPTVSSLPRTTPAREVTRHLRRHPALSHPFRQGRGGHPPTREEAISRPS